MLIAAFSHGLRVALKIFRCTFTFQDGTDDEASDRRCGDSRRFHGLNVQKRVFENRQGRRYKYRRQTLIKCYMHQNQTLVYSTLNSLHDATSYVRKRRFVFKMKTKRNRKTRLKPSTR